MAAFMLFSELPQFTASISLFQETSFLRSSDFCSSTTGSYTITGLAPSVYSMTMDCHDYMSVTASNVGPSYNITGADVSATQNFLVISDVTSVANEQSISLPLTFSLSHPSKNR